MTARQKFRKHLQWRMELAVGDTVGIYRALGGHSTGEVVRADTATVRVRDTVRVTTAAFTHVFRRHTGAAVNNSTTFMVPVEVVTHKQEDRR